VCVCVCAYCSDNPEMCRAFCEDAAASSSTSRESDEHFVIRCQVILGDTKVVSTEICYHCCRISCSYNVSFLWKVGKFDSLCQRLPRDPTLLLGCDFDVCHMSMEQRIVGTGTSSLVIKRDGGLA